MTALVLQAKFSTQLMPTLHLCGYQLFKMFSQKLMWRLSKATATSRDEDGCLEILECTYLCNILGDADPSKKALTVHLVREHTVKWLVWVHIELVVPGLVSLTGLVPPIDHTLVAICAMSEDLHSQQPEQAQMSLKMRLFQWTSYLTMPALLVEPA